MCLAIPGKVESIKESGELDRVGQVSFGGVRKEVNLSFLPEAHVGDYVLVHVGVAISVVDEQEAEQVFTYLNQMEDLAAELNPQEGSP